MSRHLLHVILQPTLGAEKCQHVVETELAVMDEVVVREAGVTRPRERIEERNGARRLLLLRTAQQIAAMALQSYGTYTLTISRDFKISKIRAHLGTRTDEASLACASDYVI